MSVRERKIILMSLASLSVIVSIITGGHAALLYLKAWAAPHLIERAFSEQLHAGGTVKPWPWADMAVDMKLLIPAIGLKRYALKNPTMSGMAFGPVISRYGKATVLWGHRDTHFAALQKLTRGMVVKTQARDGAWSRWRVSQMWATKVDHVAVYPNEPALYLVTCFPFGAINPGGDGRFVVRLLPDMGES